MSYRIVITCVRRFHDLTIIKKIYYKIQIYKVNYTKFIKMHGRARGGGYTSSDNPMISNGLAKNYNDHQFAANDSRPYDQNNKNHQNAPTGNARQGNFQSERQYDNNMNAKRQYNYEEQGYQNRNVNREQNYEGDMRQNPRNVQFAGNQNHETNEPSQGNPMINTDYSNYKKENSQYDREIVGPSKPKGDPRFSNEMSQGNPMINNDQSNKIKEHSQYNRETEGVSNQKGDPKGLLFTNETSQGNPMINRDQAKKVNDHSKYDREIVGNSRQKADPKGLLFSNETSQGNPMITLDTSQYDYYAKINAKMVADNPYKKKK